MENTAQSWFLYNKGVLYNSAPHVAVRRTEDVQLVMKNLNGFFCRWTSDFDCEEKTQWWYCIRDEKVDISQYSTKQRYRINHGAKKNTIHLLNLKLVEQYSEEMFKVQVEAFKEYPLKYRPKTDLNSFRSYILEWAKKADIWLVKDKETDIVCGYAICKPQDGMVHLTVVKVIPKFLKNDVNAFLVFEILKYYLNEKGQKYVCDGERNIRHETNFQKFLVKNLNFRYAYCHLHIAYRPVVGFIVTLLYPFRNIIKRMGNNHPQLYNIYCLLKQEEIAQTFK